MSERLVMLTDSLDEEQNPVLVIANLKNRTETGKEACCSCIR